MRKINSQCISIQETFTFITLTQQGSFYDFILTQQGTSKKKLLDAKLSFDKNFQQYIQKYLAVIKAQGNEKHNMLSSKNSKYLFCRYNDFLQMRNLEMSLIRHMKATQDYEGFLEIQNKDWSCFIGKGIAVTEVLNRPQ